MTIQPRISITIDSLDAAQAPERPWAASAEIITDAGSENTDAGIGATPGEALQNLLTEQNWADYGVDAKVLGL